MGWSGALACTCAFLLVFVCAAFVEDGPDFIQRDITDEIAGSLPDMDQREVDIVDLLGPEEMPFIEQREVSRPLSPELIKALIKGKGRERGPSMFGPRSFGGPRIPFPPGQPTASNLQAVCVNGSRRPRYPADSLPLSGYGFLHRQADAINRVESWYSACCRANHSQAREVTLCCVKQAWEQALDTFCEDEFSVKTSHHQCCKKKKEGGRRMKCFQDEAPNPAYLPTNQGAESLTAPETGFSFNPNTCQRSRSVPGPRTLLGKRKRKPLAPTRDADINFPPGRPTAANIDSVCRLRKLRPLYLTKCLPRAGYGWLARQSKAINRLERGFKVCCKGQEETLSCADGKWREVLDRFCEEEGKAHRSACCEMAAGEKRYDCFSSAAPHPGYGRELLSSPGDATDPALGQICETHKILKKKFNFGFPVHSIVRQCCPLPADQRTTCVQDKLTQVATQSESLCLETRASPPAVLRCCSPTAQDSPSCVADLLMDAITKATKAPRVRKRKCPLLS